jgi:molybdopterin/thiamine biosynthesis adenylyltransferase/rhodanese-related sulfurtransferase
MNRYSRHIVLPEIGQNGQDKLSKAKVLVIGAGGLGCPALQYLTAAGIGTLGIVDFDLVEESNLQRQVLYGTSTLGMNKATAAKERLQDLNPTICIHAIAEKLTSGNALELFKEYDIILDGTDNFATRYLINDASILTNKPVVYGGIYKFEGQVSVFNYQNGPSYRCLFPDIPKEGSIPNCSDIGVLGVLPGIIGSMQANEVIKIILDFGNVLTGKLCCYNAKTSKTTTFTIPRSDAEIDKILSQGELVQNLTIESICQSTEKEISAESAFQIANTQFIDVRMVGEKPFIDLPNQQQIPLTEIKEKIHLIDSEKTIIAVCQTGIRSLAAVDLLQKHNITNCYSLSGGVFAIMEHLKITTP